MDENILTNESREVDDSQIVRTPGGGTKGVNSINQINSAGFSNHQAMKKVKNKVINNSSKMAGNIKGGQAPLSGQMPP